MYTSRSHEARLTVYIKTVKLAATTQSTFSTANGTHENGAMRAISLALSLSRSHSTLSLAHADQRRLASEVVTVRV